MSLFIGPIGQYVNTGGPSGSGVEAPKKKKRIIIRLGTPYVDEAKIEKEKIEKAKTMDRTKYYNKIDTIFRKMIKISKTDKNGNKEGRDKMDSLAGDIGMQKAKLIQDQGFGWFAGDIKSPYSVAGDRLNQQNEEDIREHLNKKFSESVVDDVYYWKNKTYWS